MENSSALSRLAAVWFGRAWATGSPHQFLVVGLVPQFKQWGLQVGGIDLAGFGHIKGGEAPRGASLQSGLAAVLKRADRQIAAQTIDILTLPAIDIDLHTFFLCFFGSAASDSP